MVGYSLWSTERHRCGAINISGQTNLKLKSILLVTHNIIMETMGGSMVDVKQSGRIQSWVHCEIH